MLAGQLAAAELSLHASWLICDTVTDHSHSTPQGSFKHCGGVPQCSTTALQAPSSAQYHTAAGPLIDCQDSCTAEPPTHGSTT
jgi:hypothetical protein